MKYLCLGYLDEQKLDAMPESERKTFIKACSEYDNLLRTKGHFVRLKGVGTRPSRQNFAVPEREGNYHGRALRGN